MDNRDETAPSILDLYDAVRAAWTRALGRESRPTDSFYRDGGIRAQALAFCREIALYSREPFTVGDFDQRPTQADTVYRLTTSPWPEVTQLTAGTGTPLFLVAGSGGVGLHFAPLARALEQEKPVVAFESRGLRRPARIEWFARAEARRIVQRLREIQPVGPYAIGGHSLGGLIALHVVDILKRQGQGVDHFLCLDAWLPERLTKATIPSGIAPPTRTVVLGLRSRIALIATSLYARPNKHSHVRRYRIGTLRRRSLRWLPNVSAPTLVVCSAQYPDFMRASWPQYLKGPAAYVTVDDGHVGILRRSETFVAVRAALGLDSPIA